MHIASRARLVLVACVSTAMVLACGPVRDSLLDDEDSLAEPPARVASSSGSSSKGGSTSSGGGNNGSRGGTSSGGSTSSGGNSSSGSGSTSSSSGAPIDPTDPFAEARVRCVNKINALRATKNLVPYGTWDGVEACVDAQASSDETTRSPHAAWSQGGACTGSAQDECLGGGANGIESCLDQMWNERLDSACTGCDACAGSPRGQGCPDCTFSVCGHYVNMSAQYLSAVACGFSTAGNGGWAVQNFH